MFNPADLVTIEVPVYLSKEDRALLYTSCEESYCTIQDAIQSFVEEGVEKIKEEKLKELALSDSRA